MSNTVVNELCRILLAGAFRITCDNAAHCRNGGKPAIDIVKFYSSTEYITAHTAGKVIRAQTGYTNAKGSSGTASYGNMVMIDHGNGVVTLYAHLSEISVKVGDTVKRGQVIGHMGNTGNSYGAHLHFEVRIDGVRVDPTEYLNADLPRMENTEDELMSKEKDELQKEIDELKAQMPTRYHYTEELPDYCRSVVQLALDKGIISGRSASDLDISEDMCRQLVYMHKCKMF